MRTIENKKIKNATVTIYDGIEFKSKLEVMVYKTLKEKNFKVSYEPNTYTIWEGFKPTVSFYSPDNKTRLLKPSKTKIKDITYSPDFILKVNNVTIIIEVKGFKNDLYPYKRKMFRKLLENFNNQGDKVVFFEIHTKKQLLQAIDIINNL